MKCQFCKTLRTRLAVFERESSVFPRRALEAEVALRESATWGSDVELKAMESEQTGLALSLPLSPEHVCVNSPVEFTLDYLCPSPEALDAVSFGLEDVLFTAASDSEDFGPALVDALPPSSQEARPSAVKIQGWIEEATIFQWSASRAFQILEAAFLRPPYERGSRWLHQPSGFCGAGLYRHSVVWGHAGHTPLAIFGAFLEVLPPPSS